MPDYANGARRAASMHVEYRGRRSKPATLALMSSPVTVGLASRERAHELLDPICHLYDEVFSAPPFRWTDDESEHHRRMLASVLVEPTFGLVTAEADGQLVGFAYGYTLPANTRWWDGFQEPVPAELAEEREGRTFALIDLAVQRERRGHGIGRQLVDALLSGRSEERATLCVQPTAIDAQAFYDRLGWQKVGRKDMPAEAVSPSFDVYVVELDSKP